METREHLEKLLTGFSEKIPSRIIHSGKFKVRGSWFQGVIADLEEAINTGIIEDPQIIAEANTFIDEYVARGFGGKRTDLADIQRANSLIRKVLGKEEPTV